MAGLGTTEILIILAVVLLLFGSAKLPQLARSLGKSARILKAETKGLHGDDDDGQESGQSGTTPSASASDAQANRDRAAALREEAARLEREAAQQGTPQRTLGSGEPIQGVPVDPSQVRKS
jgi:TatA/E family protein of Tat protein translocase